MFCRSVLSLVAVAVLAQTNVATAAGGNGGTDSRATRTTKPASAYTTHLHNVAKAALPLDKDPDRAEGAQGLLAMYPEMVMRDENGKVINDMGSYYKFENQSKDYPSIHPALLRQAEINLAYGLYEVVENQLYQVRGLDISNLSLLRGKTGWILFDVMTAVTIASSAFKFANEQLIKLKIIPEPLNISAIIISHPHSDHYNGLGGLPLGPNTTIIAAEGFMDAAVEENIYLNNAMVRRTSYQYGLVLPKNEFGHVDQGIGKYMPGGVRSMFKPNISIPAGATFYNLTVDGIEMEFQNTPGVEAPVEMNTYIPSLQAFWAAETVTATIHNLYTLRGAEVRDPLAWSQHINEALYRYPHVKVMFTSHLWPRWGTERIQDVLRTQRDVYMNLFTQVLHYANQGVTVNEIHNVYKLPTVLKNDWLAQSLQGSEIHNSRAVINKYLGYWDCNPVTLAPLSLKDSAPLFVEMMGGSRKVISKGKELNKMGEYQAAAELLNYVVFAEPGNLEARWTMADALEQIGYQREGAGQRNVYLQGASELRCGAPNLPPIRRDESVAKSTTTSQWLTNVSITLDPVRANALAPFSMNLITTDNKEHHVVEFRSATLSNMFGALIAKPTVTVWVPRTSLDRVILGKTTLQALVDSKEARIEGNLEPWNRMYAIRVSFDQSFLIFPQSGAVKCNAK